MSSTVLVEKKIMLYFRQQDQVFKSYGRNIVYQEIPNLARYWEILLIILITFIQQIRINLNVYPTVLPVSYILGPRPNLSSVHLSSGRLRL